MKDFFELEDMQRWAADDIAIDPSTICPSEAPDAAPLRRVWSLVLTIAVVDYLVAKPTSKRFREAKEWIFYGQPTAPNSFDNIARLLDFRADRLRRCIACRREEVWADPQKALEVIDAVRGTPAAPWLV